MTPIDGPELVNAGWVAKQYIEDVLAGRVTACKWVRLAVERHVRDLEEADERGLFFDEEAGEHFLRFFDFLRHSKGKWGRGGGQPFVLAPWQQFIGWVLFGWHKADGTRRFNTAYLEIARKNGKSTFASGIGLYTLDADGEPGAEVYSAATKRDQAKITWSESRNMVRKSPSLIRRVKPYRDSLVVESTESKFVPLGADADSMDGLNIHCAIVDELHAHKTRDMWDVLETATGARENPLIFAITTAGVTRPCICREIREYATKVLEGIVEDDSFFGIIFTLDDGDDWRDESVWIKANPNLGVSVSIDDLRRKATKAKEMPSAVNNFLTKHLNIWCNSLTQWLDNDAWARCAGATPIEELLDAPCYGGLDLSSNLDLSAFVLKFPETGDVLAWHWVPRDNMAGRERRDKVPYSAWVEGGFVEPTPGDVIDYDFIEARIIAEAQRFTGLQVVGVDTWNATQVMIDLEREGVPIAPIPMAGYKFLSPASKELEREVYSGTLRHGGNPVLAWEASNVIVRADPNGNIRPDKAKSTEKIDGIMALIMAIGCQIQAQEEQESVYESRGVVVI